MKQNIIESDFKDFLESEPMAPSPELSKRVLSKIQNSLRISPLAVILKLSAIHLFTTMFVLYICPQFGVSWGSPAFSLTNFFMRFGHEACAALCGITLVGGTFLMAAVLLKSQESFWLKKQMPWIPVSLAVLTLISLAAMGASAHHTEFVLWCAFGILGGWAAFELGRKGKLYSIRMLAGAAV